MTPRTYRKKPVVIKAMQFDGSNATEIVDWIDSWWPDDFGPAHIGRTGELHIETLEGDMHVSVGDFVIRGVQGEFYPCKSDIFEATYEGVAENGSGIPVSEVRGDEAP